MCFSRSFGEESFGKYLFFQWYFRGMSITCFVLDVTAMSPHLGYPKIWGQRDVFSCDKHVLVLIMAINSGRQHGFAFLCLPMEYSRAVVAGFVPGEGKGCSLHTALLEEGCCVTRSVQQPGGRWHPLAAQELGSGERQFAFLPTGAFLVLRLLSSLGGASVNISASVCARGWERKEKNYVGKHLGIGKGRTGRLRAIGPGTVGQLRGGKQEKAQVQLLLQQGRTVAWPRSGGKRQYEDGRNIRVVPGGCWTVLQNLPSQGQEMGGEGKGQPVSVQAVPICLGKGGVTANSSIPV